MISARLPEADDPQLDALTRDDADLESFLQEAYPRITRYLERVCQGQSHYDRAEIGDAVQEALLVVLDKWDEIRTRDLPIAYVRKIALHKLQQSHRYRRRYVPVDIDSFSARLLTEPSNDEENEEAVRYLLRQLPDRQREVMALVLEESEDEAIAAELGLAITTVRAYKTEARRTMNHHREQAGYPARRHT